MKKPKNIKPFYFKNLTHDQMVELLDDKLPISVKYNEDLINRVSARYPDLNKSSIALIIKDIFGGIRALLVMGKILNFHNLFFDTKLHFFDYRKNGYILPSLKVKISTPPKLRHDEF